MKKIYLLLSAALLVIVLVGGVVAAGAAMYVGRSDGPIVHAIIRTVPVPAARVGEHTILYSEYLEELDTMRTFLASEAAKEQGIEISFDATLEENIYEKLVNAAALEDVAQRYEISVTDVELLGFFDEVAQAASSTQTDIGTYLLETYGWNEEEFRQNVLRPALLEQKISAQLAATDPNNPDALALLISQRLSEDDVKRYVRF